VITPRQTRLVRVAGLRAFQAAIAEAACDGPVAACRARAVIVPTRAAAHQLRRTIERLWLPRDPRPGAALALPDLVTRDDWYGLLHGRLAGAPPRASEFEREVLFGRAAREAAGSKPVPVTYTSALNPGGSVSSAPAGEAGTRRTATTRARTRTARDPLTRW